MSFQDWIRTNPLKTVDHLDRQPTPTLADCEQLRHMIREVELRAVAAGLPQVASACQVPDGPIWPADARQILAACLESCR